MSAADSQEKRPPRIELVRMGVYRKRQPSRSAWAGAVRPTKKKTNRRTKKK